MIKATDLQVKLRGPRVTDVKGLGHLFECEKVIAGLSVMPFANEGDVVRMMGGENRHVIVAEVEDTIAGYVSIEWGRGRWRRIGAIALGVHDSFARQGIGRLLTREILRTGFEYLDMHKIELVVYVDNINAIKLYEGIGFVHEGTKRDNAIRDGRYVDAHIMSIFRNEWKVQADKPVVCGRPSKNQAA